MEFRNFGRIALASAVSLGLGLGMTACGPGNTYDFLYVTNSKANPGQINVYAVDSQSGSLIQPKYSPYPTGRNPVAVVATPNGKQLFVANHDDNTVMNFGIGTDGKLYPLQTCNTPGSYPMYMAVNPAGTFLFVVETYQPNFSNDIPGPGAVIVFPIASDGTVSCNSPVANGTLAYFPVGTNPVAVNVLPSGNFVYVVNENPTPSTSGPATPAGITAFQLAGSGVLTEIGDFSIGVAPNAVATDPTSRFLYVTDGASNQVDGFLVQTNGTLLGMQAPFPAGNLPDSITVDPRGEYVYAANYNSSSMSAYAISQGNGQLSSISGAGAGYAVDTGPTCVVIEPALGRYLYTTDFLGNTVTGLYLNPNSGVLSTVQNSPFKAAGQPTCAAAITHGNHAVQAVQN